MYKLLIVDDDPHARYGLRNCFNWTKYDIEVIGEAEDGVSALKLFSKLKPNIILTDIKMPKMDGIELAKRLHEISENIKIIFVSGYDDLEYLKSAIKVDAIDYILKSIDLEELDVVIRKVVSLSRNEERNKALIDRMDVQLMRSMPYLKEKFFNALIDDKVIDLNGLKRDMAFLDLILPTEGDFCVIVISLDDRAYVYDCLQEKEKQLISYAVLNVCDELAKSHFTEETFQNTKGEYICILSLNEETTEQNVFQIAFDIRESLKNSLDLSVTVCIGNSVHHITEICRSYKNASQALHQKIFMGKNQIITTNSPDNVKQGVYKFDLKMEDKLASMLLASGEQQLSELITEIFSELSWARLDTKEIRKVFLQLFSIPSRLMADLNMNCEELDKTGMFVMDQFAKTETVEDIKELILSYYIKTCKMINDKKTDRCSSIIERIKSMIKENYNKEITVNDIAKGVYLTPTYVCMIFKQETGKTINEYLTKVRLENAIQMLKDERIKLYDICFAVGYTAPSYFSRLFKRYMGLTPSEYREKVLSK